MPIVVAPKARQRVLVEPRRDRRRRPRRGPRSAARARPAPSSASILPEPDGPTSPTDLARRMRSEMPRRTLTGPAALPSVRCTSSTRTRIGRTACSWTRWCARQLRGYGRRRRLVNCAACGLSALLALGIAPRRGGAANSRCSATASPPGYGVRARGSAAGAARGAAQGGRHRRRSHQWRRLRRHHGGRAGAARLGAGRQAAIRRWSNSAPTTRCAASIPRRPTPISTASWRGSSAPASRRCSSA